MPDTRRGEARAEAGGGRQTRRERRCAGLTGGCDASGIGAIRGPIGRGRGGNTSAPKLGFAYRGAPLITNGQISFAEFPVVSAVDSGSAAQAAGIAVGDVILAVNGKNGREGRLFVERAPGTKYVLSVRRGEEVKEITFVMGVSSAAKP
jgi:S1-C subfamily serine protease